MTGTTHTSSSTKPTRSLIERVRTIFIVYAVFGAIVMVVAVGVTLGMIFFGARLLGVA